MHIAITGASGLLGGNLFLGWSRGGHRVLGLRGDHRIEAPDAASRHADLFGVKAIASTLRDFRTEWVVHAAAMTNVDECEKRPAGAMRINAEMSRCVALAARDAGARVIYISTDSVFDGMRGNYREADEAAPVNSYARSKLAGEHETLAAAPDALVVRTNMYGWNAQPKQSLSEFMLAKLRAGETFTGFDDVIFSPLLVNQLGEILLELMTTGVRGVLHVGSRDAVSKYEFGLRIASLFGLDSGVVRRGKSSQVKFIAPRPLNMSMDCAKAARLLGRSMPSIDEGLSMFKKLEQDSWPQRLRACMKE